MSKLLFLNDVQTLRQGAHRHIDRSAFAARAPRGAHDGRGESGVAARVRLRCE